MAPRFALARNAREPRTPYHAGCWEVLLRDAGLASRYPNLVNGFRQGFVFSFPTVLVTQSPPNQPSVEEHSSVFSQLVSHEGAAGWYVGPFSQHELEQLLGPFQSSPVSIIPKPAKPGHYYTLDSVQNCMPDLRRPIPHPRHLVNLAAFSDASSGIGIAITVGNH